MYGRKAHIELLCIKFLTCLHFCLKMSFRSMFSAASLTLCGLQLSYAIFLSSNAFRMSALNIFFGRPRTFTFFKSANRFNNRFRCRHSFQHSTYIQLLKFFVMTTLSLRYLQLKFTGENIWQLLSGDGENSNRKCPKCVAFSNYRITCRVCSTTVSLKK